MSDLIRSGIVLSCLLAAVGASAGCASTKSAVSTGKPNGVAVVDLDNVAKRLGQQDEIDESRSEFRERIQPVAEEIAKERGMGTVVTKDNPHVLTYASDADITDAVIAKLKKEEAAKLKATIPESAEEQAAEEERANNAWRNAL